MSAIRVENDRLAVKVKKGEESQRMLQGQLNYVKRQRDEVNMMQELEHTKILHDSQSFKDKVGQLRMQLSRADE